MPRLSPAAARLHVLGLAAVGVLGALLLPSAQAARAVLSVGSTVQLVSAGVLLADDWSYGTQVPPAGQGEAAEEPGFCRRIDSGGAVSLALHQLLPLPAAGTSLRFALRVMSGAAADPAAWDHVALSVGARSATSNAQPASHAGVTVAELLRGAGTSSSSAAAAATVPVQALLAAGGDAGDQAFNQVSLVRVDGDAPGSLVVCIEELAVYCGKACPGPWL